jgi:hypothetical protein
MKRILVQRDSFLVEPMPLGTESSAFPRDSSTHIFNLPDGQRVHILDRAVFNRAVRAAMQPFQEKKVADGTIG